MTQPNSPSTPPQPLLGWTMTIILLALGCWLMAICWHEWLSESLLAANFDCESGRRWLIRQLGGRLATADRTGFSAHVPFEHVLGSQIVFTLLWWIAGAVILAKRMRRSFFQSLLLWGSYSSTWWLLAGSWTMWRFIVTLCGWNTATAVFTHFPELWLSFASAGWMTTFVCLCVRWQAPSITTVPECARTPWSIWFLVFLYTVVFGTLNTLLYNNLLVPHGDSAMYEEHLWNLLHGKGFRSFIDKGLFLGEHIQVIHLGLIPVYAIWQSHIMLEWCESLSLALGAIPVYHLAARQTQSRWKAICLAGAYLLYVPMQRLDISIDFKTFRPEAFGIPLLLAALNALDGRKWLSFGFWLIAALLVKEDYALIIAPLGIWMAAKALWTKATVGTRLKHSLPGILLSLAAVSYLYWSVKVAIPYFKAGNEVHYAKYFSKFGATTNEILLNLATKPGLLWNELGTAENFLFGAALIFSLALVPLFSPGRLAVGLPLFGALCLNEIARNTQHHFHAPLVAIVFWAAAAGLHNCGRWADWLRSPGRYHLVTADGARFAAIMMLFAASGFHFWHGMDPGGLPFWDSYSGAYWRKKYVATRRAAEFEKVAKLIAVDQRVAATDFVHPRFNHYARCYDYSGYRPEVPDDAEFLVIDVHGPYSEIRKPQDVDEYRRHPDRWELLPDSTDGQFYVFRRRHAEPAQ
ncbi:MAG: hypothetical protein JWM11_320 [Planctomycetaceae bacterium]|nr:hypothetical protein [Planctomycetaceae bacterium]